MMENLKKFFRLNRMIMRNAYIRDSKLFGYVFTSLATQFLDIGTSLILFYVVFLNTKTLAGWNFYQVVFLYAFTKFIASFHAAWTKRGLTDLSRDLIRLGDYDFYLTKPFNPMLHISIRRPRIYTFVTVIFEIILMVYTAMKSGIAIGFPNIIWFVFLTIFGLILYYFLTVITVLPAFWFTKVSAINDLMNRMVQFMKYPAPIFPRVLEVGLSTLFPVVVISYFPAKTLFYPARLSYIIYMVAITVIFGFIATKLWLFAEKNYGSASS